MGDAMSTFLASTIFGGSIVVTLLLICLAVLLYILPVVIAWKRQHPHFLWILLLDLFLGWTTIGWLVALFWSFLDVVDKDTGIKITLQSRTKKPETKADE